MSNGTALAVRRFTLVALVLPFVIVAVGLVVQLIVLPTLPDPVAVHWGASGAPDGFGPAWLSLVLTAVVGLGIPLLIAASALGPLRRGDRGSSYRLLGATALGLATLMSVLGTATLTMQAWLADATDAPHIWWALVGSFAAALVAGAIGWALQPDEPYRASVLAHGAAPDLSSSEHTVWRQSVQLARGAVIALGVALAALVLGTVTSFLLASDVVTTFVLGVTTVVLIVLFAMTAGFHVRVDDDGLSVISVVGLPRVRIPLAEIAQVEAVDVQPMGEFGGWGLRWAPGSGFGVVLRSGPGIRVQRTNGKRFTVTVDDAETGAALLAALRGRGGARGVPPLS